MNKVIRQQMSRVNLVLPFIPQTYSNYFSLIPPPVKRQRHLVELDDARASWADGYPSVRDKSLVAFAF